VQKTTPATDSAHEALQTRPLCHLVSAQRSFLRDPKSAYFLGKALWDKGTTLHKCTVQRFPHSPCARCCAGCCKALWDKDTALHACSVRNVTHSANVLNDSRRVPTSWARRCGTRAMAT
jgi:isochorismate hydrolase